MEEFKWIWGYVKKYRYIMAAGLFISTVVAFLNMVAPYVQGMIVDRVIIGGETGLLAALLLAIAGATLVKSVMRYVHQYIFEHVSQNVVYNIREEIYIRMQSLDFEFFDKTKTGDIMSRMTGDLEAVRHFTAFVVNAVFHNLLSFFAVMAILISINFKLTLFILAVAPPIGFLTYRLATKVKPAFTAIREQFSKLNSVVQENISGNRVVKAFAKENYEIEKFSKENGDFRQRNLDAAMIWQKYLPALEGVSGLLPVIVILSGGVMVMRGNLTMGELVTFSGLLWALSGPLRMSGWLVNDIQRFAASAEKIKVFMMREPLIANVENPVLKGRLKGGVEFRNVSFSYGDERVLKNISFAVKPGQTIGIVGSTGSGKSTLVSLICRFYDCTDGEVLVDGINVKDMELKTLRRNISVAMQDIFLFSDTIEGNIAYGVPEAPAEDVAKVAEIAQAHYFINEFPEGYDTIIGERGVGLSGGQRQRVALARALLKNPAVLILDDTTSSVDIETEHEIREALGEYYKNRTTFIIAHRISSVRSADLILVLDNGEIVERGTHEELIEAGGYYCGIYESQYGDLDEACREKAV